MSEPPRDSCGTLNNWTLPYLVRQHRYCQQTAPTSHTTGFAWGRVQHGIIAYCMRNSVYTGWPTAHYSMKLCT